MAHPAPSELKASRGHLKGQITKAINSISGLMSGDDLDSVKLKVQDFDVLVTKFNDIQAAYISTLTGDSERCEAEEYRLTVEEDVQNFRSNLAAWFARVEAASPVDTVDNSLSENFEPASDHMTHPKSLGDDVPGDVLGAVAAEREAYQAELEQLKMARLQLSQLRSQVEADLRQQRTVGQPTTVQLDFFHSTPRVGFAGRPQPDNTNTFTPGEQPRPSWGASSIHNSGGAQDLKDIFRQVLDESRAQSQLMVDKLHIPKPELMSFDGDPLRYYPFIRSFDNAVANKTDDDSARLNMLIQYCTGPVKGLLECCLVKDPGEGYRLARQLLEERFGNKDEIAHAWLSKVLDRPKVSNAGLLGFVDDLRGCSETLKTLGYFNELDNSRSLGQIIEKLPPHLQTRWLKRNCQIKDSGRRPALSDIIDFIKEVVRQNDDPVFGKIISQRDFSSNKGRAPAKGRGSGRSFNFQTKPPVPPLGPPLTPPQGPPLVAPQGTPAAPSKPKTPYQPCPHCNGAHYLTQCQTFKALRVKDRIAFVHTKGLCVNCFKPGHFGRDCPWQFICNIDNCGQKHSKFLHLPRSQGDPPTGTNSAEAHSTSVSGNTGMKSYFVRAHNEKVALPIVAARIRGSDSSKYVDTYALVDPGGTSALCSQELARQLGIVGEKASFTLSTVSQKDVPTEVELIQLHVSDLEDKQIFTIPQVIVRPALNVGLDNLANREELRRWNHLADLPLPPALNTDEVHLIIGQDTPDLQCPQEVRAGGHGEPYATRTVLGWAMNGPIDSSKPRHLNSNFISIGNITPSPEENLDNLVEQIWQLEKPDDDDPTLSVEDRKVLQIWEESIVKEDGRYGLNIPFKTRPPSLPDNRVTAEHRLKLLGKRLQKDAGLRSRYQDEVQKLLDKQYAEVVPVAELGRDDHCVWHLPHHPVINPKKPEKCRIVFDCAAKSGGTSLNAEVYQGPDLTNRLLGVMLRFRQGSVAFMADIESMFLQVNVKPCDRDVLRFLWWKDHDPLQDSIVLRMRSHLFGGVWSPSCVNFALRQTVEDNKEDFTEETQKTVLENFYVDDCLKSLDSTSQAIEVAQQLRLLLRRGGFNLTKWISNSRELLHTLPECDLAKGLHSLDMDLDELPSERALGLLWNVEEDSYQFDIKYIEKPQTRRGLLSIVSSVYDPMGFVSPFVLGGKRLFQELCRFKLGWDEPMPSEIKEQWGRWQKDLPQLKHLSIPRCIHTPEFEISSAQLHHFADASEYAYGAVSYLRLVNGTGQVSCSFMLAKSRLAPLKSTTIPRLELAAAVEAVKLDKTLTRELQIPIDNSVFWSDSMIVLWYLQHEEKRFQTFVANRVATIRDHCSPHQWRHVPSELNPADDASRGLSAQEILHCERWWQGPDFLLGSPQSWPQQPDFKCSDLEDMAEIKQSPLVYTTVVEPDIVGELIQRYLSWHRLKKAIAWILRFKSYLKCHSCSKGPLTVEELRQAERAIILYTQKTMSVDDPDLKRLMPYKSPEGIICVGGRLNQADLPYEQKHQTLLPAKHHVTTLIIRHYHALAGHAGVERILSDIRARFWIIKGRGSVKRVLSRCIPCKKLRARPETQLMADLPMDRITPAPPFDKVGIDYFGPFIVRRSRSDLKRYGCIFTCLVTRAIHIEVSYTLDTDSFINALERFIARRGKPRVIRSDNGSNFVSAQAELKRAIKEWNQTKIEEFLLQKNIQWHFNPPTASHMGGVWERQIRTIRDTLRGLLKLQTLDDEALMTLMCLVESIVNSRPITKLSDDPRDPTPLTPNHLLLLRSGPALPPGVFVQQDLYRRRWRQVQYMADVFWKRWLAEYLPCLQERQKWLTSRENLKVGDLVLLLNENFPRSHWPLGLITNTYPSPDGIVRSVQVKTQSGIYDRPITKLCLLEGSDQPDTCG